MLSRPRNEPSQFVPGQAPPNFGRQRPPAKHAQRTACVSVPMSRCHVKFAAKVYEMLTSAPRSSSLANLPVYVTRAEPAPWSWRPTHCRTAKSASHREAALDPRHHLYRKGRSLVRSTALNAAASAFLTKSRRTT